MASESHLHQCFICGLVATNFYSNEDNLVNDGSLAQLSTNLDVVYILRKLLEVPSIHLENQLKECGGDPGSWIQLCDQCTQLTRKARKLDREMRRIEKQLRCVRKQVVETMIGSGGSQKDKNDDSKQKYYLDPDLLTFEDKIRSFVKTYDYADKLDWKDDDPAGFLEGDKLAKYLVSQQNPSTAQILMVEIEKQVVLPKEEIKIEVEPPSPSSPPADEEDDPGNPRSSAESSEDADDEDNLKMKKRKGGRWANKEKNFNGSVNGDGEIKCGACWKTLKSGRAWSEHVRIKHGRMEIQCPGKDCGMQFKDKFLEFQENWKKVHSVKEHRKRICNYCGMELENWEMLKKHKNNKHYNRNGEPKGPWICDICGERDFSRYRGLQRHRKIVHKVNMNGEPIAVDLDAVKKMRKDVEKVLCNLCGKELCDKWSLDKHLKLVHDKEYEFRCHVCGLGLRRKGDLDKHLLAVHKEDPVAKQLEEEEGLKLIRCGVKGCGARFLRQGDLDKHVERKHEKGRRIERFQCKICGKGFWGKFGLVGHEKAHERKERRMERKGIKCEICGKGFGKERSLKGHWAMVHK